MLSHFLIALLLSFVGSLPFGMINMTVAHAAIRRGLKYALWAAAGAAIVELMQVFVALKFAWYFTENTEVEQAFQAIAAVVFFAAGTYFFFFAKAGPAFREQDFDGQRRGHAFLKGMFISSLNLMVIPYWIFYGTLLTANGLLKGDNPHLIVFSAGTMFGTFSLLVCYALLGARILSKSELVTSWVNKFIGALLFAFGGYQLVELLG